jgi:hypothetical protein
MSISPFSARPETPETERRRARMVVLLATLGILAALLAYAASPTVRHAVGHAAHSVKVGVGNVLDRDKKQHAARAHPSHLRTSPGAPVPAPAGPKAPEAPKASTSG